MNQPGASAERRPQLKAPPGLCDCHMHVYEPRFPGRPGAAKPPVAPVADYLELRARLGIQRTIVVQPNAYGTDNRCTLEAMAALGPSARGVAVVDPSATDAEQKRLNGARLRGQRFLMFGGVLGWDRLEEMARRVHPFGWHINLQFDGREFPERIAMIERLPSDVVIDHVGKFIEPVAVDHASFQAFLRLLDKGRIWVKLSAPYETSRLGPPHYADVGALAKALVKTAPERLLWGSNWPHPSAPAGKLPDDVDLLDVLLDWAPDEATRRKILVDNPARLYGFGAA
jgi:D-galactarolactone isomerase